MWFNNVVFREYILQAAFDIEQPESSAAKAINEADILSEVVPLFHPGKPNDCLGINLQLVFSLMKESIRKSIDPNFFIKALGLDENMQQVYKLFLLRLQN